ncbi:spindle assembly checkpoint component Mad1 [Mycena belliarum]|uniref:Spindle assembly checkpoint component MAD1 n=1 Tax=Mycena belliarum TaxID=1033014 RepID=A0AAD6XPM3_9AGAR|nr:spindle assembly checkpoint component Mad1 [Mycena belliae]
MAHAALERQLAAAQTTRMELETKLRERDMLVEKLERDRRWLSDREQEERDEKERERAENAAQTERKDNELRALRSELTTLREELADLTDVHASLGRSTAQTIASQRSQVTTLTRQAALLEEEVSQFKLLAEERSQTIDEIQTQFQELSSISTPNNDQESNDMAVVREELHRQASYLRTLEATNSRLTAELTVLRERHTSIEVLREEKRGLEIKLQPLEAFRERVVRLEAQVEAGREERETWARNQATSSSSASTSTPPVSVTHTLSALRLQHAQLLEDHGATSALLRAKEAELADAEQRVADAQNNIERLESEVGILTDKAARCEQHASLADREVGFMKALLSSYSLEEANKDPTGEPVTGGGIRAEQVQNLEALLQDYKAANIRLSQQVNEAAQREPADVTEARVRELDTERAARTAAQEALDTALAEVKAQAMTIDRLEQELFELSGEIAGGRHVPPGVRVLSLADTPELLLRDAPQAREAETARVRGENAALLQQLAALQAGGARAEEGSGNDAENLVPRESWDAVCNERDDLQKVVRQKETRLKRLQEVFKSKAEEFKESIAALLGVKLAFFPSGQVRVTSLYDLDATFVFKPSAAGGMELVAQGEGGPEDLPSMLTYWVGTEQCIPGFLASVTLEVYDRWKRERAEVG